MVFAISICCRLGAIEWSVSRCPVEVAAMFLWLKQDVGSSGRLYTGARESCSLVNVQKVQIARCVSQDNNNNQKTR